MKNSINVNNNGDLPLGSVMREVQDLLSERADEPDYEFELGVVSTITRLLGLNDGWIEDMGILLGLHHNWYTELQENWLSEGPEYDLAMIDSITSEELNDRSPIIIKSDWYFKDDAHLMVITTDPHGERKGYGPMATGELRIFLATPPAGEEIIMVYPWAGTFADTFDEEAQQEAESKLEENKTMVDK